jgi:threonylcarbamoyladenosine tRNA methylthiotransferase MtaB
VTDSAVDTITFGCRLNIVESEALAGEARGAGEENLVIVNTCAVTAESTRQARQAIRRLHRERPDARIIVTGCAATIAPTEFLAMEGVTRVVGNGDKSLFAPAGPSFAAPKALGASEGTRGFLAVQNGCDHRCTFCIIPFGRGPSRSAPPREIVARARELVASGKREIVLTGVDLTSYGGDLGGGETLGRLARLDRLHRGRPDIDRGGGGGAEAGAASASLLAVGRRPDLEADEAPPFPPRRDKILRGAAFVASRYCVRRRFHRRLPDRN